MYILFEGIVGSGKTTQSKRLAQYLNDNGIETIWTREPGGTEISDKIREVVQGTPFKESMEPVCEAYLYAASRAQSLRSVVKPNLEAGKCVIADRSFLTSIANQGYGRELGPELVLEINKVAIEVVLPDLIFYLKQPLEQGLARTFDGAGDKFESLGIDFYKRVEQGYEEAPNLYDFKNKWLTIDASGTQDEVFERILAVLPKSLLEKKP